MIRSILLVAAVASVASARVMDRLAAVPRGWETVRRASPGETVSLRIALKQQRSDALEQAVLEISDPGHPKYGRHLTRDELRSYTAPSESATLAVTRWLDDHNIQSAAVENDWVSFSTTVENASNLLKTDFAWYRNADGGGELKLRTLGYSVPDEVATHIDLVQPTTRFGQPVAKRSTIFEMHHLDAAAANKIKLAAGAADGCNMTITPDCLKWLYDIKYTPTDAIENTIAFASFLEQYARYDDFQTFQSKYVPEAQGQNFTVELVNGGLDDQKSWHDSGEANLDIQYILGVSHPIPILQYSTGGRGPLIPTKTQPTPPGTNEPYLEWLTYLLNQTDDKIPKVISVSYGEEEQSIPRDYAVKVCNMFMQLGARGVSVIFASGDSGPGTHCIRSTDNSTYFEPTFPAGCPYVTSVGATFFTNPERAIGFSSGGFSMYHPRPKWQRTAVEPYLRTIGDTYAPYFDPRGRAIPDIAAQGSNFNVIDKGWDSLLSGTSASAPVIAGIVGLLNAARYTQGLPSLGFLNPWLYNNSDAFTDIVVGAGVGCRKRKDLGHGAFWNATVGWDPVTGLGTPKFGRLLELAAPGVANA
ncbi:peptidase S8/S53 domain-containing protein [Triangularia verruculosa]|uniref:tripeptidyl-peptidase II n=1 Tax=Triangularia verruculosa TaxID=2587418 RepID=A0AAN7ATL1_9PEZI|nr:peptidase S8/S53 domain-containing protein [Triangularia verruculosa]